MRNQPALRSVRNFHDHPGYIAALAQSVNDYWFKHGRPDKLVMSFHGVPQFTSRQRRPVPLRMPEDRAPARAGAQAVARPLSPSPFSRGSAAREWLKPYTAEVLNELGRQKRSASTSSAPGFVADCLETLEEIAIEGKAIFLTAGGQDYHAIPCLNERNDWIHALADIVAANLGGWVGAEPSSASIGPRRRRARSRSGAKA